TSISLKPILTSCSNMRILRSMSMGSINAWLPSRRSTLHHTGGLESTASGHVRSVKRTGTKGRYLLAGFCNIDIGALFRDSRKFGLVPSNPTKKARRWKLRALEVGWCTRALLDLPVGHVQ